jgi:DNA-binding MarR family transcriptional regulator
MATPRWLTETEQESWRNYILTAHDLEMALEADLAPHGLSMGDYEVLVWLSEAELNRMRMCDLAQSLQLSPSGLTRRLDGMVRNGWVDRASCASDRRVMYAHLTPAGRAKMEEAAPTHVASVRRHVLEPLGPEGVAQLGELFGRVRDHLLRHELTRS